MHDGKVETMMGLEDITIEELEAEFDRLQERPALDSQETNRRISPLAHEAPLTAQLHEVYNVEGIAAIRKGVTPRSEREDSERTIHDRVPEQPGAWDPVDYSAELPGVLGSEIYILVVASTKNRRLFMLPVVSSLPRPANLAATA